jgi:hypothetical protein
VAGLLRRQAMLRGVVGGNRVWQAIWVVSVLRLVLRRFTGDKPVVLFRTELGDNDALVISSRDREPVHLP